MRQVNFDDLSRGTSHRPRCRWCKRTESTGLLVEDGLVILGRCILLGGTAYDRRCDECTSWEVRD